LNSRRLQTSPFFVFTPANRYAKAIDLRSNERFRAIAPEVFSVVNFFLEPNCREAAEAEGISPEAIDAAVDCGILLPEDSDDLVSGLLWEESRWSRAAYLIFSQQDLPYLEPTAGDPPLNTLVEFRRASIQKYLDESAYPGRHVVNALQVIDLPNVLVSTEPDLDSLVRRRSVRAFDRRNVDLETFAGIMWDSTHLVRAADATKETGDPFYLLNSFYTWLELYVAVQGVKDLRRGVYQYDMKYGRLLAIDWDTSDEQILPSIQHQDWIGGGGFCVFITVHWERYQWIYRHSRAYVNLLIQLGEICQEMLQAAYRRGLAGWPTPAIHESKAAALLRLDENKRDVMYFVKIGPPRDNDENSP
jgi:SagB-type dehydrogenase family enzyme